MDDFDFSWSKMTEEERQDAETRGRWTNGKCPKCRWYDHFNRCCNFICLTGVSRRKADTYGGACPEYTHRGNGAPNAQSYTQKGENG